MIIFLLLGQAACCENGETVLVARSPFLAYSTCSTECGQHPQGEGCVCIRNSHIGKDMCVTYCGSDRDCSPAGVCFEHVCVQRNLRIVPLLVVLAGVVLVVQCVSGGSPLKKLRESTQDLLQIFEPTWQRGAEDETPPTP